MQQSLALGITSMKLGWKRILEQEGLSFKQCPLDKKILPTGFAAIIVNSTLSKAKAKNALDFLEGGGAIITSPEFAKALDSSISFTESNNLFIKPVGKFFENCGLVWLNQKPVVFGGYGKPCPLERRIGKGFLIVLPFDLDKAILEQGFEKHGFAAGKASVAEFSSKASKSNIRVLAANCLKALLELRGLPFVQKWYYPKPFKSVFCFHVDVDTFTQDTLKTIALFKELGFKPTWFLNMQAAEADEKGGISNALKKEAFVGQHAFEHNYFQEPKKSFGNVVKGHKAAMKNGFKPKAFCAPNGVWGQGIARAVEKLGYSYAVAFSIDHDNLPFRPILDGGEAGFLLLPQHPICIGVLKLYDFNEAEMAEYFQAIAERNLEAGLPLLFYGHALKRIARFPNLLRKLVSWAKPNKKLWKTSHLEFAAWWNERQAISFTAVANGPNLNINAVESPKAVFRIVFNGKQSFWSVGSLCLARKDLRKGSPVPSKPLNDTVPEISPFGKKHLAKSLAGKAIGKFTKALGKG